MLQLENIIFNKYEGKKLRYRYDIAMLITRVRIAFSPYVIPACMLFSNRLPVSSGNKLRVCKRDVEGDNDEMCQFPMKCGRIF